MVYAKHDPANLTGPSSRSTISAQDEVLATDNQMIGMETPLKGAQRNRFPPLFLPLGSSTFFSMNALHALPFALILGGVAASAQPSQPPPPSPDLARNPAAVETPLNPALPTLWIAGDSTAARGAGEMQQGWAVPFADYFDATKVNVANRARGGRSSRTFVSEGLWAQMLADVKPGDVVLIQFGHNDGGAINQEPPGSRRPLRARASLPGLGEEQQEIDNVVTKKHEVVHTFGWYLRKMVADTKAKGATPILMSLTVRNEIGR